MTERCNHPIVFDDREQKSKKNEFITGGSRSGGFNKPRVPRDPTEAR